MTSDPIYCAAVTYRATRDAPQELCDELVSDYGELCERHDADARSDDEYDRYLQSKED